jgi:hypothetical protein
MASVNPNPAAVVVANQAAIVAMVAMIKSLTSNLDVYEVTAPILLAVASVLFENHPPAPPDQAKAMVSIYEQFLVVLHAERQKAAQASHVDPTAPYRATIADLQEQLTIAQLQAQIVQLQAQLTP